MRCRTQCSIGGLTFPRESGDARGKKVFRFAKGDNALDGWFTTAWSRMSQHRLSIRYGYQGVFECQLPSEQLSSVLQAPTAVDDLVETLRQRLSQPIDFPPLSRAIVEGDRVVIVLDRNTPCSGALIQGLWEVLETCGVAQEDTKILQPAAAGGMTPPDPRLEFPDLAGTRIEWQIHNPDSVDACGYLATTTAGERVYLSREIVDADFVICVGSVAFDSALGYRGTYSSLYPGLSTSEALQRAVGAAHAELDPDDPRPLRQIVDEIGWLLGTQFVVQVIPSGQSGVADVFAGLSEPTLTAAKRRLSELWRFDVRERAEIVVAAVDIDPEGHSWPQVAAALDTARRIVARDGRILLLTELSAELSEGLEMIREARTPREAVRRLQRSDSVDRSVAIRIAQAIDRANVYLLSGLQADLVEDLFMIPVTSIEEAGRVLSQTESCAVIGSAQNAFVRYVEPEP